MPNPVFAASDLAINPMAFAFFVDLVASATANGGALTKDELRRVFAHACADAALAALVQEKCAPSAAFVSNLNADANGRVLVRLGNADLDTSRAVSMAATALYTAGECAFDAGR